MLADGEELGGSVTLVSKRHKLSCRFEVLRVARSSEWRRYFPGTNPAILDLVSCFETNEDKQ